VGEEDEGKHSLQTPAVKLTGVNEGPVKLTRFYSPWAMATLAHLGQ